MGFFKKIGRALKGVTKSISIKNGIKAMSGKYGEIVKETTDRFVKDAMGKDKPNPELVKYANEALSTKFEQSVGPTVDKWNNQIAKSETAQGLVAFGTKIWFKTMFEKYKPYIIAVPILLVVLFSFTKVKSGRRR